LLIANPAIAIELTQPIDCVLGKNCFIQNYVDVDSTSGVRDYSCDVKTYNGHKGTDFRLNSAAEIAGNYAVKSAAPGRVKAVRDGMWDRLFKSDDRSQLAGRECGNGVIIDHGFGWETQYCHLKKGSVSVRKGDKVERGDVLGYVGYSGMASFAHLHFGVRHNQRVIDPFSGLAPRPIHADSDCKRERHSSLWKDTSITEYGPPRSFLLKLGFSSSPVKTGNLERGGAGRIRPVTSKSPVLLVYARFINLQEGDRISLKLSGPEGFDLASNSTQLAKAKAHYVAFAGKRRKSKRWTVGAYRGQVQLIRNGEIILTNSAELLVE